MSIVYGLQLICDLSFYLAVLDLLHLIRAGSIALPLSCALLSLCAGAGFARMRKKSWPRIALLALALPALWTAQGNGERFLCLPMLIYSAFFVRGNADATDHYYAFGRFRIGAILLALLCVMSLLASPARFDSGLAYLLVYMALNIALLRMLRHDEDTIRRPRFQAVNLCSIAGVFLGGFLISRPAALHVYKQIAGALYAVLLRPILAVVLWVLERILHIVAWIASFIPLVQFSGEISLETDGGFFDNGLLEAVERGDVVAHPWIGVLLKAFGILILIAIGLLLLKLLARHPERTHDASAADQREHLEDDAPVFAFSPSFLRRRSDPRQGVRAAYRRFLTLARQNGIPLNGRQNSREIVALSEAQFDRDALNALREVYIRARYADDATPDDARRATEALQQIKNRRKTQSPSA